MRFLAAAATIAACVAANAALPGAARLPDALMHAAAIKADAATSANAAGGDSCRWANDNECDEPDIGTGVCALGTDTSDCSALRHGENDSCRWARDGICDEPAHGTGACAQGADREDCGDLTRIRNQTDSCATAFNDVCEEPGRGNGACAARTDRSDCNGRERPLVINDHFFGRDDRVLVPVHEAPWNFMGLLQLDAGGACTATLIGRNVVLTAAHCIHNEHGVNARGSFESATGEHSARVIAYLVDQRFDVRRFNNGRDVDGHDWALLRLDQPLGDRLGFADVRNLTGEGRERAIAAELMQAGYAWDTGGRLSGHLQCHILEIHDEGTFEHNCDVTRGDSGSAFLIRNGAAYEVVGLDSKSRREGHEPFDYVAVSSAAFAGRVPDFLAGRTGVPVDGKR